MAEQRIDGAGCLGRVLTLVGVIWLAAVVFAGVFGLRDEVGNLAGLIGSTVPGLVLIGLGRTLSRRATERREAPSLPEAATPSAPSPTGSAAPQPPRPAPSPPQPSEVLPKPVKPAPQPAAEPEAPTDIPPPPTPPAPKTSQEMIEEARKRWGSGPRPGDGAV